MLVSPDPRSNVRATAIDDGPGRGGRDPHENTTHGRQRNASITTYMHPTRSMGWAVVVWQGFLRELGGHWSIELSRSTSVIIRHNRKTTSIARVHGAHICVPARRLGRPGRHPGPVRRRAAT